MPRFLERSFSRWWLSTTQGSACGCSLVEPTVPAFIFVFCKVRGRRAEARASYGCQGDLSCKQEAECYDRELQLGEAGDWEFGRSRQRGRRKGGHEQPVGLASAFSAVEVSTNGLETRAVAEAGA